MAWLTSEHCEGGGEGRDRVDGGVVKRGSHLEVDLKVVVCVKRDENAEQSDSQPAEHSARERRRAPLADCLPESVPPRSPTRACPDQHLFIHPLHYNMSCSVPYFHSSLHPAGSHPTLRLAVPANLPLVRCPLYLHLHVPSTFIADRYQLRQLHDEHRLGAPLASPSSNSSEAEVGASSELSFLATGEADLELPASRSGEGDVLIRLRDSWKGKGKGKGPAEEVLSWEVPLHLRYQEPVRERYAEDGGRRRDGVEVGLEWPSLFWDCGSEDRQSCLPFSAAAGVADSRHPRSLPPSHRLPPLHPPLTLLLPHPAIPQTLLPLSLPRQPPDPPASNLSADSATATHAHGTDGRAERPGLGRGGDDGGGVGRDGVAGVQGVKPEKQVGEEDAQGGVADSNGGGGRSQ